MHEIRAVGADGGWAAIALDSRSFPVVSFFDGVTEGAMLALCTDAQCSSASVRPLDNTGRGRVGEYSALALTTDGRPVVSFWSNADRDLLLAICQDPTCSAQPALVTLDHAGQVGQYNALALQPGNKPVVSYVDELGKNLKLCVCLDAACSATVVRTLDTQGMVGAFSSIAMTSAGYPVVSYYDKTNEDAKLVVCADPTCV